MFNILLTISLFSLITCSTLENTGSSDTFYYFAYGSNLLAKRLHIQNPSAVFYSPAKLANHRLDFITYHERWNGAVATIVEDDQQVVWGAVWTLNVNQMQHLDQQEGVDTNIYFAKNVTVTTPSGKEILARTYQETVTPTKRSGETLSADRLPSSTYLGVIILGAIESNLPAEYIASLFALPANGKLGSQNIRDELGYPF